MNKTIEIISLSLFSMLRGEKKRRGREEEEEEIRKKMGKFSLKHS